MDASTYITAVFALLFVLGLIGLTSFILKKFATGQIGGKSKDSKRLSIEEIFYLDTKRKLVLIKRDGVEHLILIGVNGETIVEQNIVEKKSDKKERK